MKGKANASIFSFQGHIIILRLLSFFIKVFICFISNSPDFKIWILWLQPNFTITPFQGLSGSIVASSASDTRCTFSNDFAFFVLKEKKLWWKQVHNFEFMQIKHWFGENAAWLWQYPEILIHLVIEIMGENTTAIYLNFNYIIYAICRNLKSRSKLYIDWCTNRITPEFLYQDMS